MNQALTLRQSLCQCLVHCLEVRVFFLLFHTHSTKKGIAIHSWDAHSHWIVEWLRLEGTLKIEFQPPWRPPPPDQGPELHPTRPWAPPRMGHPLLSGQQCQRLTSLWVKNFFLTSNLNLPSFSLKPFPLVLSLPDHTKRVPLLLITSLHVLEGCSEVSQSFLQAKQAQLPQPFSIREVLQPSEQPCVPSLDSGLILPRLEYSGNALDTALQMSPNLTL